jgi:hypothetical protein
MRDHAHMARAYTAWGQEGLEGLKALLLQGAQDWGLAALRILASETTAQELPMGSPTEPGIVRGVAQRCGRVLTTRKTRGVWGVDAARAQVQTLLRSVKDPHLVAKGTQGKRQGVTRWRTEGGQLVGHTRPLVRRRGHSRARVIPRATAPLGARHEVAKRLIPQPVQWITTGVVAKGTRVQAGVTQARAIVRHKAGTEVALGLPSLLRRLGGGDIFGTMPWRGTARSLGRTPRRRWWSTTEVATPRRRCRPWPTRGASRGASSPKATERGTLPRPSARPSGASVARPKASWAP